MTFTNPQRAALVRLLEGRGKVNGNVANALEFREVPLIERAGSCGNLWLFALTAAGREVATQIAAEVKP